VKNIQEKIIDYFKSSAILGKIKIDEDIRNYIREKYINNEYSLETLSTKLTIRFANGFVLSKRIEDYLEEDFLCREVVEFLIMQGP